MSNKVNVQATEYVQAHGRKKRWHKIVTVLASVVVFCTTYALIMPAVTMQTDTYCGYEEHVHTDDCYEQVRTLLCELSEEGHEHGDECYEEQPVLICNKEETEGHTHGDGCYEQQSVLSCENTDPEHVHDDECYELQDVLVCGKEECEPHQHGDECYELQNVLICKLEEQEPHEHSDECWKTEINKEKLICEKDEHEHTLQCYSNPGADLESEQVWKNSFASLELTGNWNEDVIAIAKTQIGVGESTANYDVQEDGTTMKGITRYGQWYGNPYGDWCAMFCSFCLNYAEVDRELMPIEQGCTRWVDVLRELEYIHGPDYEPTPGDLVFFDYDHDGLADHVGLVYEVADGKLRTIEGNNGLTVRYVDYELNNRDILCYCALPENPEMSQEATTKVADLDKLAEMPMMLMAVSGNAGNGVTWEITPASDGSFVLTFEGNGKIPSYYAAKLADTASDSAKAQVNQELVGILEEIEAAGNTLSIVIGPGITEIGTEAFYNRGMFTSVTFADNSNCTKIGNGAFRACNNVTTVDFGQNGALETIDTYAFYRMQTLKTVNLENCRNLTTIGAYAFAEYNKIEEITIPASVVKLNERAFYDCGSLKKVTFKPNENLNFIGRYCFSECDKMESINLEALTNSCIKVGYTNEDTAGNSNAGYTFSHTYALKEVTIPSGFKLNGYTLFHFSHVGKITFQENNNTIPYASSVVSETYISELDLRPLKQLTSMSSFFYDNPNLHTVWIPKSVTTISSCGGNTPNLRNIYFEEGSQLEKISSSFHGEDSLQEIDLSDLSNLKTITGSFHDDPSLKTIKLPNNGKNILLDMSFYNCPALEEVDLTDTSVNQLSAVFHDDENLKRVALPTSFTVPYGTVKNDDGSYTKKGIFYNDPALEDLYINSNVLGGSSSATTFYSDDSFVNCAPFTLHLGADIDALPLEFLQDASRSCGDILFAGNNNITFTKYEEAEHTGAKLPSMLRDLEGEYYADASGALYKLNADGTATLVYVPAYVHQDKWDEVPLAEYTIPESITDAKGDPYTVTSVRPDAFLLAENLEKLTVNGTEYDEMNAAVDALNTKYGVEADLDKTSLENASGPQHDDPDDPPVPPYDPRYPEGGAVQKGAITETTGLTTLTVSTSTGTSAAPVNPTNEDQYELFTNENAQIVVSLSNKETADSKIARVYFAFDSPDYFFTNTTLDQTQTVNTEDYSFSYVIHRIEGTDTYYLDIGPVEVGATGSLTFKPQFSSPDTDGGRLKIWGEVIDYVRDPDTGEPVLDEDENPILPDPNTNIPAEKQCQVIEWITKPDPFAISKTADNKQKLVRRGNTGTTEGETVEYDLVGLSYTLELTREGNDLNLGKNYVDYVEFSDTLTLPEDIVWRDGVIDAIRNGQYMVTGGTTKALTVTLGDTEYTVATVKATGIQELTAEIVDGKLKLNWKVENSSEAIEYSMGKATVVFGDEMLMLDPEKTYEEPETLQIDNHAESDVYYNYATADQYKETTDDGETVDPYDPYHTEADAPVTVTTGQGEINLTKSVAQNDYWGSPSTWTITASNPTAFPYDDLSKISDNIGRYITIHPDGMARMFDEDKELKELTVTITKATLCLGDGITEYPTETVTTVDGSTTAQTSIQNSTVDAYEAYHGCESAVGDVVSANNQQAYTVVIGWNSDGTGLELTYSGKSSGTVDIGEPTEANIAAALESIHFLTDNETYYRCEWTFEDDRNTLAAEEKRVFHIYADNKDTFEWITHDFENEYYQSGRTYSSFANTAYAHTISGSPSIASSRATQGTKTRELVLRKNMSQGGVPFSEDFKLQDNMAVDNTVTVQHYGTGSYELMPVVDHMSGSQIAMAPVSENPQLAGTGLETKEYNGEQYYLLSVPGTYSKVWMGGYCADSITVKAEGTGLDTITKWYFKDTAPRAWTFNINYPTWVGYSASGASGSTFEVENEVWAGDHPTHRLHDGMIGRGTTLDFNKFIVDTNDWDKDNIGLEEYMPIGTGETVRYRLRVIDSGMGTVTGSQIYDALPDTHGAFEWTKDNVRIVGYKCTNDAVTLSSTPSEGDPISAKVSVTDYTDDIGGWSIGTVSPVTGKTETGQYYILWDDDFAINYSAGDNLDIYVELSFPADGEGEDAKAWSEYCLAAGGESVYNTFYLDGLPDSVYHDLKAPIKARLQKGVFDTGYFNMPMDYTYSWSQFPYVARNDTIYYSNDGADTAQRVNYYVNLYNEGPGRLYLDTIQDVLPEGFTYYSLTTAQLSMAHPYVGGADRSFKKADFGRTEYVLYNSSGNTVMSTVSYYKLGNYISALTKDYVVNPLSEMIAKDVEYVVADINVDASGRTEDGRQIVKATIGNSGASTCTLLYDEQVGKYYLNPNQCIRFGYSVNTNGYNATKDYETNTVTMPVYDPYSTGLSVSGTLATAKNNLVSNDGDCELKVTPLISEKGFDTANYAQSTQWLISDVTVLRDTIQPGIDKADTTVIGYKTTDDDAEAIRQDVSTGNIGHGDGVIWTLTSTNSSESTLHDYTITDTMPAPFEFKGPVYINVYDETHLRSNPSYGNKGNVDMPLISSGNHGQTTSGATGARPLFELLRDEGSCALKVTYNNGTFKTIDLTSGQTVKVGGTGTDRDVTGVDLYRYRNVGNERGELLATYYSANRMYEVTWTKTDAGETLQIHFVNSIFDIPSRGSMTLEYETRDMSGNETNYRTYYNEAWLTPSQSFTNVAQGRDTTLDGAHSVYDTEPVNLVTGYTTISEKTVTEVADPTNTASSSDSVNYIDLPGIGSLFDYGLMVTGPAEKAMTDFVLIDNLPEVNDHVTFVDSVPRNSPFKVSLAETPNFRLYLRSVNDTDYVPFEEFVNREENKDKDVTYTIEYAEKNGEFDDKDWRGQQNYYNNDTTKPVWLNTPDADTRSIRLRMSNVPANTRIKLVFTAKIDGEAEPGTIAWNNFGYSYKVDADWLNATPPNVGIRVPPAPKLQKKLELDGEPVLAPDNCSFTFAVYKGSVISGLEGMTEAQAIDALTAAGLTEDDYRIYTLNIAKGASESAILTLKDEDGFWVDKTYYNLVELDPGAEYEFVSINQRQQRTFTFQYLQSDGNLSITAVNKRSAWQILLTKIDARSDSVVLKDAVFGLYSPSIDDRLMLNPVTEGGDATPYTGVGATVEYEGKTYYLTRKSTTGANGQIKWAQLYQNDYVVVELEAPPAYRKTDEIIHIVRGEDETILLTVKNDTDYELPNSGGVGTLPFYTLGGLLTAGALMCGHKLRRRRERRAE